ncbi:MAG: hypothetical protein H6721_05395 [Sandaracinus sp.]|nr:hypothetical protein [Sandaracinus sp.]
MRLGTPVGVRDDHVRLKPRRTSSLELELARVADGHGLRDRADLARLGRRPDGNRGHVSARTHPDDISNAVDTFDDRPLNAHVDGGAGRAELVADHGTDDGTEGPERKHETTDERPKLGARREGAIHGAVLDR